MKFYFLVLFLSSASLRVYGIPTNLIQNESVPSNETMSAQHPSASLLLEISPEQKVNFSLLHPDQLMNSSAACETFTNGSSSIDFSSPSYPNDYPDNIDCIKIIKAPEGHVVDVKFHDFFDIEAPTEAGQGQCPYDYLEIRNGMFGYSPPQGKVCGIQPPTMTRSTGQYLWLRFHSDSTITCKGFRALITFPLDTSPSQDFESCTREIGGIEGKINSKNEIPHNYLRHAESKGLQIDCTWIIQTHPGKRIFLRLHGYSLEHPNDCTYNKIEIYTSFAKLAGRTVDLPTTLCGSLQKPTITSDDHVLALRLTTRVGPKSLSENMKRLSHFEANYTIVRPIQTNATCGEDEFDCSDNNCIPSSLRCDAKLNCALKNDEENCPDLKREGLKADLLIISFLGCLLVIGMCSGMCLNIYRKLKQDREELEALRALQRKSHESGLQLEAQSQNSICPSESHSQKSNPLITQQGSSSESSHTVIHRPITTITESTNTPKLPAKSLQQVDSSPPPVQQSITTHEPNAPSPLPFYSVRPQMQQPLRTNISKGRRASGSDVMLTPKPSQEVVLYRKPSDPPTLQHVEVGCVAMQFVRDCACQTRESFLMSHRNPLIKRAPLARTEPMEFQGMPLRRSHRQHVPGFVFPPSSASSEIGNSLERLDEEFE